MCNPILIQGNLCEQTWRERFSFEKNDHKDLNTNIERIFKDNELYNNLCLGARKRFDLMFSNKEVYKYLEIYNNCFQKD